MRTFVFFLLLLGSCVAQDYFPASAFSDRKESHQFRAGWYSSQLKAMEEPPLFSSSPDKTVECYRFIWLRTFHRPVVLRVDVLGKDDAVFTIKVADGAGGYEPGKLIRNERRKMDSRALEKLQNRVGALKFFEIPSYDDAVGFDGSFWVVEALVGGRYHVVARFTPSAGPIHSIGTQLIELAIGGDFVPIY